ncbi:hypothetical protein [Bosea massiliensis]|jgi:hypothetical protein|uniref:Uncharacterized protein n=1 Tax=Bosea massiliensis TaxID=151419 RepID=A0ABW0NY21_9HYPH
MALLILVAILNFAAVTGFVAYRAAKGRTNLIALSCLACFAATVSVGAVLTFAVTKTGMV